MPATIKNTLIGFFVFAAIGIIIFILLFLHPRVGDNAKTLRVRFVDIDKVNVGTRVTFAGRPVGKVVSIQEIPEARASRAGKNGDVYAYELIIKVDSGVDIFNTDEIFLRTSGLLGEKNIEINPLPLKPGQTLQNIEGQIIYAEQTGSVEDTMKQFSELSKKFSLTLDDIQELMQDIKREEIVKKISQSLQNVLEISEALNQPQKLQQITDNILTLTTRANQLAEKAHHSWGTIDSTLERFNTTSNNAIIFSEKANKLLDYTLQGKGTLGQLFVGEELYLRLKSIFHKGEVVMNDINTYGLLFHLNKRWQRLQANRLRLLEKLSSPKEFARYFNDEMDQISSSLSRVSMVLNNSDCYPQSLIYNADFTQRFAELLRRVENMEESLKMYNEQVIDQE